MLEPSAAIAIVRGVTRGGGDVGVGAPRTAGSRSAWDVVDQDAGTAHGTMVAEWRAPEVSLRKIYNGLGLVLKEAGLSCSGSFGVRNFLFFRFKGIVHLRTIEGRSLRVAIKLCASS